MMEKGWDLVPVYMKLAKETLHKVQNNCSKRTWTGALSSN